MSKSDETDKSQIARKVNRKKTVSNQSDTDISRQQETAGITVGEAEKLLKKHRFKLIDETTGKRIYRNTKDQLKDASKGPRASSNRLTKQLSPRIYDEHRDLFNKCAVKFPSKREALERAIELLADDLDIS